MKRAKTIFQAKIGNKGGVAMYPRVQDPSAYANRKPQIVDTSRAEKNEPRNHVDGPKTEEKLVIKHEPDKPPEKMAIDEFKKEEVKKAHEANQKLDALFHKASQTILRIKSVWPFDFFPDEVIVDIEKVDFINRSFFWSSQTRSVMLKNISDVIIETSIFFATIRILDKSFVEQELSIHYLPRSKAIRAKNIIQGLASAVAEGVDLAKVDLKEVVKKAEAVGQINTKERATKPIVK